MQKIHSILRRQLRARHENNFEKKRHHTSNFTKYLLMPILPVGYDKYQISWSSILYFKSTLRPFPMTRYVLTTFNRFQMRYCIKFYLKYTLQIFTSNLHSLAVLHFKMQFGSDYCSQCNGSTYDTHWYWGVQFEIK